jgi:hypothetical protein
MDRQSIGRESFREPLEQRLRVALVRAGDDEIVGIADQHRGSPQVRFHFVFEPFIQHIVQIEVTAERVQGFVRNLPCQRCDALLMREHVAGSQKTRRVSQGRCHAWCLPSL